MTSSSWSTRALVECGRLLSGGTPSKKNASYWGGDIPWFSSKEVRSFELTESELRVTAAGAQNGTNLVPPGTVMFVVRGMSLAKEFRVGVTSVPATFNQDVKALVPSDDVDGRYLARCLRWLEPRVLAATEASSHGTKRLSGQVFERLEIPLPPLDEQRRIADILDKADAIRRKRKEAMALTEDLLRSAFLEMFGDPVTNPKGWDVKRFDDLVQETRLGLVRAASEQHPERAFPYVRMNAIRDDGYLDLSALTRVDATAAEVASTRLADGDFLFNTRNSRELVGKAAVFHAEGDYLYNNNIMRVRFVDGVEPDFVCAYWQTNAAQRELERRKAGTTSVFAIYYKSLATMPVPVPPTEMQRTYAELCAKTRQSLRNHELAAGATGDLFDSLVQRAFRGKLVSPDRAGEAQLGLFGGGRK